MALVLGEGGEIMLGDGDVNDLETLTLNTTISAPITIESGNMINVTANIALPKITVGGAAHIPS